MVLPIGTERIRKIGGKSRHLTIVKITMNRNCKNWKRKDHIVLEQNGIEILPWFDVIYLDGDTTNCNFSNLLYTPKFRSSLLACEDCGKESRPICLADRRRRNRNKTPLCIQCFARRRIRKIALICPNCGRERQMHPNQIKKRKTDLCSSCYQKRGRIVVTVICPSCGTRRIMRLCDRRRRKTDLCFPCFNKRGKITLASCFNKLVLGDES